MIFFPTGLCGAASIAATLFVSVLAPLTSQAADDFEGRVRMKVSQGEAEQSIDYFVKGERMRVESGVGAGAGGTMILDMNTGEVFMLLPEQKMYTVMPVPELDTAKSEGRRRRPEPQAETRSILGHEARKYLLHDGTSEYEIWATKELGKLGGLRLPNKQGPAAGGPAAAFSDEDFFPLLIIERRNGEVVSRVEVQQVEKESLPDSLFEPPADFEPMKLPVPTPQQ